MEAISSLDDRYLVQLYKDGNEAAFKTLLFRHKDKIFRFIRMKVKDVDLSNDIFQDTLIKVVNTIKLGSYNEEGKFLPWVMRIAHNLIIDHFRKKSRVRMISEASSNSSEYSILTNISCGTKNIEDQITSKELLDQMVVLVDYLPKTQREIVNMRIFHDMSFKEIAETENISINTALGRMRYALINLRKLIDKHGIVVDV
ncbi:MAG: sigma-70 family RNA polymerase sigma factor [Crocinitomicaceae bacterium]|jgi:RNA polymerase sigma-70 factor (ECF subfamily)|nr:sigma-70 family RNA polymerase sigma factor [Crocinitomicaceae bacterium]MCF8410448.1 sigma-70 family RNA polymerase sigma factor [Crocinitomicaceae bacterium]MCF8445215.1 sigma-70 family RNA polymerase sigma factor [Crocinitomicaceae bacterium]